MHSLPRTRPQRRHGLLVAVSSLVLLFAAARPADAAPTPTAPRSNGACTIRTRNDSYVTTEDAALTVDDAHGVVANDTLCGTDGLVISTSSPSHGTLEDFDDSGGGFTYTPSAGFVGTDSFTYVLEDVEGSPQATVRITVDETTTSTQPTTTSTEASTTSSVEGTSMSISTTASEPPLPVTGSDTRPMLLLSGILLGAGLTLTSIAARRRRTG